MSSAQELLTDSDAYAKMARGISPYGDGLASERIARTIEERFVNRPPEKYKSR